MIQFPNAHAHHNATMKNGWKLKQWVYSEFAISIIVDDCGISLSRLSLFKRAKCIGTYHANSERNVIIVME